jgi:hypothetical protein
MRVSERVDCSSAKAEHDRALTTPARTESANADIQEIARSPLFAIPEYLIRHLPRTARTHLRISLPRRHPISQCRRDASLQPRSSAANGLTTDIDKPAHPKPRITASF